MFWGADLSLHPRAFLCVIDQISEITWICPWSANTVKTQLRHKFPCSGWMQLISKRRGHWGTPLFCYPTPHFISTWVQSSWNEKYTLSNESKAAPVLQCKILCQKNNWYVDHCRPSLFKLDPRRLGSGSLWTISFFLLLFNVMGNCYPRSLVKTKPKLLRKHLNPAITYQVKRNERGIEDIFWSAQ